MIVVLKIDDDDDDCYLITNAYLGDIILHSEGAAVRKCSSDSQVL